MKNKIFEGQYDHVLEDNHHELLDEIISQVREGYGGLYDDSIVKFKIEIKILE